MKKILILLVVILLSMTSLVYGEKDFKFPIEIKTDEMKDDSNLKKLFIYAIKEEIRKSSQIQLTEDNEEFRIRLIISALPMNDDYPEDALIYQIVWLSVFYNDSMYGLDSITQYYIQSALGYFPSEKYEIAAKNIVVQTNEIVEDEKHYSF